MHLSNMLDLTGKVALVTGGSRGLGLEIAEGMCELGAKVVITGRRREWLDSAQTELSNYGFQVGAIEADVTDQDAVEGAFVFAEEMFGGIDILVNNAGVGWAAPLLEYPIDKWQKVLDTDLTGAWLTCQAAAPRLIQRGGGKIVNVSSIRGQRGIDPELQDTVAYHAAKGGLDALTRQLAVSLAPNNICVNAVAPGYFATRMTEGLLEAKGERLAALAPMRRIGRVGELKGVVAFLASEASNYVTGQVINVDGGASAW